MTLEMIVVRGCPTCEGPAQAIETPDGVRYRHIESTTLRQQAGRVDGGMVREVIGELRLEAPKRPSAHYLADKLEAALAQNTQGDGELTDERIEEIVRRHGGWWDGDRWLIEDADLHPIARTLHAERARVPEWLGAPLLEWALGTIDELNDGPLTADQWAEDASLYQQARAFLAAAPSQPKDAGEVENRRQHHWDRDGERCLVCGDKDWMGGPCNGPRLATTQPEDAE